MIAYVGQCRGRKLTRRLQLLGIGEMTVRGELPPRRYPYAFDNGAYRDFTADRPFDFDAFGADLEWLASLPVAPDFVVAPDTVGGGEASLETSLAWIDRLARWPVYLAVQDGMSETMVAAQSEKFSGVFVGGSTEWKRETFAAWARFAKRLGLRCHVGRVSGPEFVDACYAAGVDSIDSCQPLWSEDHLRRWLLALRRAPLQGRLYAT